VLVDAGTIPASPDESRSFTNKYVAGC